MVHKETVSYKDKVAAQDTIELMKLKETKAVTTEVKESDRQ